MGTFLKGPLSREWPPNIWASGPQHIIIIANHKYSTCCPASPQSAVLFVTAAPCHSWDSFIAAVSILTLHAGMAAPSPSAFTAAIIINCLALPLVAREHPQWSLCWEMGSPRDHHRLPPHPKGPPLLGLLMNICNIYIFFFPPLLWKDLQWPVAAFN